MVPLALVCLSMMTNVPQRRIPERRLSFKSLHPIHLLMPVKRITVARLTCVWGSFVANYQLTAAVGGAYPAGPREERLKRSMCVFKTCFSSNSIFPFSPQVFEWEWIHSCCQRPSWWMWVFSLFASELCTLRWWTVSPSSEARATARVHVWSVMVQGMQKAPNAVQIIPAVLSVWDLMLKTNVNAGREQLVCSSSPPGSSVTCWLTQHLILSAFLHKHLSRSLSSCWCPNNQTCQCTWFLVCNLIPDESLPPQNNMLLGQAAQFEPSRTVGQTLCTQLRGCGWAPNIRKASRWVYGINDSRARLQTKKNTQNRLCAPTLCPTQGRTCASSCQLVSCANNKFFARTWYL